MTDAARSIRGDSRFLGGLLLAAIGVWVAVFVLLDFNVGHSGDVLDLAIALAAAVTGLVMIVRAFPSAATTNGGVPEAGWYTDLIGDHQYRYWDGRHWTHVSDVGTVGVDELGDGDSLAAPRYEPRAMWAMVCAVGALVCVVVAVSLGFSLDRIDTDPTASILIGTLVCAVGVAPHTGQQHR